MRANLLQRTESVNVCSIEYWNVIFLFARKIIYVDINKFFTYIFKQNQ